MPEGAGLFVVREEIGHPAQRTGRFTGPGRATWKGGIMKGHRDADATEVSERARIRSVLPAVVLILAVVAADGMASVRIQSRVDGGPWRQDAAISPLKGQRIALKVARMPGASIRWYRIVPDLSRRYKNADFPWDPEPYKWRGFAKIDYRREEFARFRDRWEIEPFDADGRIVPSEGPDGARPASAFDRADAGTFRFQVEINANGRLERSPGIDEAEIGGLPPAVFRISIRDGEGYLGYLTSFFNVPGVFGSVPRQSGAYIGVDCADVLMAAYSKWRNIPMTDDLNVAMMVARFPGIETFDLAEGRPGKAVRWGNPIRQGDIIAVRYPGKKQYQHVGALARDANRNGLLDGDDVVIHAGPDPLHYSFLKEGIFDGHVVILRLPEAGRRRAPARLPRGGAPR